MDPGHPSEALLPRYEHNQLEVLLTPIPETSTVRAVRWLGWLPPLFMIPLAYLCVVESFPLWFVAGLGLLTLAPPALQLWYVRRVRLRLDPSALTLTYCHDAGRTRTRSIPLSALRTAHVTDRPLGLDQTHRLRLVLESGEEILLKSPLAPTASLEWLASEICTVLANAREASSDEEPPELAALLSDAARRQLRATQRVG